MSAQGIRESTAHSILLSDVRRGNVAVFSELREVFERVIAKGGYILGPEVENFERMTAQYLGVDHAMGVGSGTDAIFLALRSLDIGPGDYVLTSPFTFFATVSAILAAGARPVFADIDAASFNLDPARVQEVLSGSSAPARRIGIDPTRVRVVVPVHLYGQSVAMSELREAISEHSCAIVEDAAQAFGAAYRGSKVGTVGDAGCYSFFPTKNLGAIGDGGLVVTNSDDRAAMIRELRAHGARGKYYHDVIGTNSRLDALQAGFLGVKLRSIAQVLAARRAVAARYESGLAEIPDVVTPAQSPECEHSYNIYTVRVRRRDAVARQLRGAGVQTGVYYPVPAHLQPALAHLGYKRGDFPVAEESASEVLSLPMFPELEPAEQDYVIACLHRAITDV